MDIERRLYNEVKKYDLDGKQDCPKCFGRGIKNTMVRVLYANRAVKLVWFCVECRHEIPIPEHDATNPPGH